MTDLQKATLRGSEIRSKLNELAGLDDLTEEQVTETDALTAEYRTVEARLRALTVAADAPEESDDGETHDPDAADRELRTILAEATVGKIFAAAVERRSTDGQEAELQKHFGLGQHQVPLDMLRETRVFTAAPADVGTVQQPILMPIFASTAAAFMGIPMPRVAAGDAIYPVLTNRPTVGGPHTDSTAVGETEGSFTTETLAPGRLQASFFYRRTDVARFAGMGEALRMALTDGLAEALDAQVFSGPNGLLTGAILANNNAAAITTFAKYLSDLAYSRVDGRSVDSAMGLKIVMGGPTYAHAGSVYRANNSEETVLDRLGRVTGGVRVSAHVPAVAASKQNALVRVGMRRDYVAPIWEGVSLIPDEITKADTGEIVITAVMLMATKLLRASGFHKQQTQHA